MKRILVTFTLCLCSVFGITALAVTMPSQAEASTAPFRQVAACAAGSFFGFPSWDSCLTHNANGGPQITKLEDIWLIAFPLVETMIRAAGYLAVGFIVWGGVKYIKSAGNASEITAARTVIQNAIIGLLIAILSVAAVQFVAGRF